MFRFSLSSLVAGSTLLAGLGLGLRAAGATAAPHPTDTIQIKLSEGASMTLFVKNQDELRKLRAYKMDSLMSLLDRYITQAQTVSKFAGDAGRTTMEFYPAQDLNDPNAPEKLRVVVDNGGRNRRVTTTSTRVEVVPGLSVNVRETSDGQSTTQVRIAGTGVRVHDGPHGKTSVQVGRAAAIADSLDDVREDSLREVRRQRSDEDRTDSYLLLGVGLNSFVDASAIQLAGATPSTVPVELDNWGSRYLHLGMMADTRLFKPVRSVPFLRYGVQFAFNNYMLDGNRQWLNDQDVTKLTNAPDGRQLEKSKLATSVVQVPLQLGARFHNQHGRESFAVTAGGFVGYRLSARTKLKYQQDGDTKKTKERGSYNLNDFQYGLTGSISIFGHELFATYNLNEVFRKDRGPQANVIAFGWNILNHDSDFRSKKYRQQGAVASR